MRDLGDTVGRLWRPATAAIMQPNLHAMEEAELEGAFRYLGTHSQASLKKEQQ
jgi:hypothetical protein